MSGSPSESPRIVVLNYRTPAMTLDCLASLEPEVASVPGTRAVVVDNASGDGSAEVIAEAIAGRGWGAWATLLPATSNRGFAAGNNEAIRSALAEPSPPSAFLLMNSDTIARPGMLASLMEAASKHPEAGLIGPRLEWPDGTPQAGGFRWHHPVSELIGAAATGPLTRLLGRYVVALPPPGGTAECQWLSFACVLIRREVFQKIGLLDEGFFMYYEDVDFSRRAVGAGFGVLRWPEARVVHLRGGSSAVKSQQASRRRISRYYYESRARYYAKHFGPLGPLTANLCWTAGRGVSLIREAIRNKRPHTAHRQGLDIWTNWRRPLRGGVESRAEQIA